MNESNPENTTRKTLRNFCDWVRGLPLAIWLKDWIKAHPLWAAAHFLNIVAAIFIVAGKSSDIFIFPVVVFMGIVFVQIYTEPIESIPGDADQATKANIEKARSQQRNKWMIFAYSFMLLSLLLTIFPFIDSLFKSTKNETENEYLGTLRERPIAVFIGCTKDSKAANLRCEAAETKTGKDGEQSPPVVGNTGYAWVINIGGHIEKCSQDSESTYGKSVTCEVKEGLVIPLYFIIMALMGGSISLTRRLPELQKQAGSEHIATEQQPKLSQYEFREHLIFQMVQFISAPFLAILAYYLVEPGSATNAVALAFIAGFASETILLMVRSVANKITPQTSDVPQYGAIAGIVKFDGDTKGSQKVEVFLTELPHLAHAIADAEGFYTLNNVPVGEHSLSVKPVDQSEILVTGIVKVAHAQIVVKKNFTLPKQAPKQGDEQKQ